MRTSERRLGCVEHATYVPMLCIMCATRCIQAPAPSEAAYSSHVGHTVACPTVVRSCPILACSVLACPVL